MKATFDIPEELHRKVKAKSALEGRPVREVVIELFRQWVGEAPPPESSKKPAKSAYDAMKHLCGALDSGVTDLASNPAYLEGLGQDSLGHR